MYCVQNKQAGKLKSYCTCGGDCRRQCSCSAVRLMWLLASGMHTQSAWNQGTDFLSTLFVIFQFTLKGYLVALVVYSDLMIWRMLKCFQMSCDAFGLIWVHRVLQAFCVYVGQQEYVGFLVQLIWSATRGPIGQGWGFIKVKGGFGNQWFKELCGPLGFDEQWRPNIWILVWGLFTWMSCRQT